MRYDDDALKNSEIIIKNYRLKLVKDPVGEGLEAERSLLTKNKGTSIHVSNSILRPEIHKFGTHVTPIVADVFPVLETRQSV